MYGLFLVEFFNMCTYILYKRTLKIFSTFKWNYSVTREIDDKQEEISIITCSDLNYIFIHVSLLPHLNFKVPFRLQ